MVNEEKDAEQDVVQEVAEISSDEQDAAASAKMNKEGFVEYLLGVYSTSANPIIKESRVGIDNCFRMMPALAYNKDAQKDTIRTMLLKILSDEELTEGENKVLNLHYSVKKFLKPLEEYDLKYSLMDLVYSCYDFYRGDLAGSVEYIDKLSNFINKSEDAE